MKTKELSTAVMFEGSNVRVLGTTIEPWFIAVDVCRVLGYSNTRDAIDRHVDEEDKNTVVFHDGKRGNPNITIINESGLYALILGSELPVAKKFKRWVTSEVLPSIRKYGYYDPRIEHTGVKGRPRLSAAEVERREREKEEQKQRKKRDAIVKSAERKKDFVLANGEKLDVNSLRGYCRELGATLQLVSGNKDGMVEFLNNEMVRRGIQSVDDIWRVIT